MREWPEIDEGKTFSYILRVKAVDVDYIGAYKDQRLFLIGKVGSWILFTLLSVLLMTITTF